MQKDDLIRLNHMLEAAKIAMSFADGRTREDLDIDIQLVFSLVKAIEIIGEAANKVSREIRKEYPSISWQDIIGMRNRLIHAYYAINLDVVWSSVTQEIPELITELEKIPGIQTMLS